MHVIYYASRISYNKLLILRGNEQYDASLISPYSESGAGLLLCFMIMHTFRKHGDLLDGALLLHVGPEEVCHGGIPPLPRLQAGQVCFVGQVQGHVGEQKNECLWCNCWRL